MGGWIKVEKDLANDPRVLRMASRLSNGDVTLASRSRLVVVGALVTLWWYADTHIGDDDVLAIGANEIDQLVGLEGFCGLMPQDWLQVLDADHVKLVDYTAHNGSLAKNKALNQKRQERHRHKPTSTSRSRNAPVTQGALPDKTETRQRQDPQEREERAHEEPRGTVIDCGTNLTRTAAEIYGGMLDDWRRDVPECCPDAFSRWIAHRESRGKIMGSAQRLGQAKQLAGNGDFAAQAEVVDFCITQGWNSLVPITDVRARRDGMSRGNGKHEKKPQNDTIAWARLKERAGNSGFRDPWPVDSPASYETALREHERSRRQ